MSTFTEVNKGNDYMGWTEFTAQQIVKGVTTLPKKVKAHILQAIKKHQEEEYMSNIEFMFFQLTKWYRKAKADRYFLDAETSEEYLEYERAQEELHARAIKLAQARREALLQGDNATVDGAENIEAQTYAEVDDDIVKAMAESTAIFKAALNNLMRRSYEEIVSSSMPKAKEQPVETKEQSAVVEELILPTFVEIRQQLEASQLSQEEALELCRRLIETMYHSKRRTISNIDEERMLELVDDYAQAVEDRDVDFMRLVVRDRQQNLLLRETVFVSLVLRGTDPAAIKAMFIKSFIDNLVKQCKQELMTTPRLICHQSA